MKLGLCRSGGFQSECSGIHWHRAETGFNTVGQVGVAWHLCDEIG